MANMSIASVYLMFYNVCQLVGWLYIFGSSVFHVAESQKVTGLWDKVSLPLKIFQTTMVIEVLHSLFGLVRSSALTTLMQIASRVFVVWLIFDYVPVTRVQPGLVLCVVMWSVAEITRYLYYLASAIDFIPYFLVWSRYSFFLVLYPLGVLGETLSIYFSLPTFWNFNIGFFNLGPKVNVHSILIVILIIYIPGLAFMYTHMLAQRKKVLSKPSVSKRKCA